MILCLQARTIVLALGYFHNLGLFGSHIIFTWLLFCSESLLPHSHCTLDSHRSSDTHIDTNQEIVCLVGGPSEAPNLVALEVPLSLTSFRQSAGSAMVLA